MSPEEKERRRNLSRRARKLRNMGKPQRVLPHEYAEAMAIIRRAHASGMSLTQIGYQLEMCKTTLSQHMRGERETMRRETYNKLLRLQPELPERSGATRRGGAKISPQGSVRRLQALTAMGWPIKTAAPIIGVDQRNLAKILLGKVRFVYSVMAADIAMAYDKLIGMDPLEQRASWTIEASRREAARRRYAPPHCWDEDTIDDPDAHPEWTGACGTEEGYRIHVRETVNGNHLPPCEPCRKAAEIVLPGHQGAAGDAPFEFNAERFSEELDRRGINPRQLAIKMGRDPKQADRFYRWRTGDRSPKNRAEVYAVAAALDLEPGDLMRDLKPGEGGKPLIGQPGGFNPFFFRAVVDAVAMTQYAVGDLCGVSQTTVAKWIRGEFQPTSREMLAPLAEKLGVDVEVFYT